MLWEVTTFLLGIVLTGDASKYVFTYLTEKVTWMGARAVCSRDGGSLASNYSNEDLIDLITNVSDPVWIGNYYSPWAWLLGCYSYKPSRDHIEIKANQMKECLNHCHKTNYFGLQNKKCFCFDTFEGSPLQTFSNCKYECPGNSDERCGGEYAITIYMNDICYENSAEWQGTVSQTWSGKQCLPWASIEDVKNRPVKYFPDGHAENASNYCRNPFRGSKPWCYINQTHWEYCNIPPCKKAAEDGIYPCMSFKKPKYENFEFTQEDCQNEHFAICTDDNNVYWEHNEGTWQNARQHTRSYSELFSTKQCQSLAGPQIFRLKGEDDVDESHWFGFFRETCNDYDTVPNKMPTKCFSLSKGEGNDNPKVEDCDNKNHFICQYMAVTCGDTFNNSLNGSFETPGYTNSEGYGDYQHCVWKIIVPDNHNIKLFFDILIEDTYKCNSDILKVFEESYERGVSLCDDSTKTFNTTGNHVTIEFKSDGTANQFRGVQVEWFAVPVPTSPPEPSTSKTSMTEELLSSPTTKVSKMTTVQNAHVDADTDNKTLADGTLVGMIVGILIGLCLVLGIVLFCAKRRKASKNNESKINSELDSNKNDENTPAILSGRCNSGSSKRPSSEIYHNTVTESENVDYSLPNKVDEREKAVVINSVSVSYRKKNGKDGCDHQSGGNSDVYNTLHETTKNVYQNHTENVYNHFTVSKEAFDHAMQGKADTENVYNNFSGCKEVFGHTATLTRQADAENVYNHLNDSEETYDHTTISKRQSKAGATVASDSQTYDHLAGANEPTYDVTSM